MIRLRIYFNCQLFIPQLKTTTIDFCSSLVKCPINSKTTARTSFVVSWYRGNLRVINKHSLQLLHSRREKAGFLWIAPPYTSQSSRLCLAQAVTSCFFAASSIVHYSPCWLDCKGKWIDCRGRKAKKWKRCCQELFAYMYALVCIHKKGREVSFLFTCKYW